VNSNDPVTVIAGILVSTPRHGIGVRPVSLLSRIFLALLATVFLSQATRAETETGPSLLFDAFTGEVISQERAGEPWYPASLTKLMTAYVIFRKLRAGTMTLDQKLTVSELAHSQPPSKIGIPVGKTVSVDLALQALLVYSANDMAYVLAEGASGSIKNFAAEMNQVARDMGLAATHYENPNGLWDPRQITSARDIGIIAALIINQFPEYSHYFKQEAVVVGKRKLANHNSLIRLMPEAMGMKTGFICDSGYNLVGSAMKDGRQLVSVVLGAHSSKARTQVSQLLLQSGFDRPSSPEHPKVADIVDQAYGMVVPANMTRAVCKSKPDPKAVSARKMSGWAISFGKYDEPAKAEMALRGRLIAPAGINAGGTGGVIQMSPEGGFSPVLWGLDEAHSRELCKLYQADGAPCDVIADSEVAQMAAAAPPDPAEAAADGAPTDEGSDEEPIKADPPKSSQQAPVDKPPSKKDAPPANGADKTPKAPAN
jgi:D-alanyl-D-alanine carboxypeptidase